MRKHLLFHALVCLGLMSLTPSTSLAQGPEAENRNVVRHVFERAWNDAHFDSLSIVWAADAPFHFRGGVSPVGPEGVQAQVERWRRAFPDLHFVIEDMVADGDRVAARLTFTGTHSARFMGVEPSGRWISVTEMMFFRLVGARIVEAWEDYDEHELRRQMQGSAGGAS